jgi:manganese transport protein
VGQRAASTGSTSRRISGDGLRPSSERSSERYVAYWRSAAAGFAVGQVRVSSPRRQSCRRRGGLVERQRALRSSRLDIGVALGIAGLVNVSMLLVAAGALHGSASPAESLEDMHGSLGTQLGPCAALAFALALLASGLASGLAASSVGTLSGQVVMEGFLRRRIPLTLRRLVTMVPPLGILAIGVDPTRALVLSQVVLSFGIPFALVPLILLSRRHDVMGALVNHRTTTTVGVAIAALISGLNIFLLVRTLLG